MNYSKQVIAAFALVASLTHPAVAQAPSSAECIAAADSLTGGSRHPAHWSVLAECPQHIGQAVSTALQAAASEADSLYWFSLMGVASAVRDPSIMDAAVSLAENGIAVLDARLAGMLIAVWQLDPALSIGLSDGWRGAVAVTYGAPCTLSGTGFSFVSENPVPADFIASGIDWLRDVTANSTVPGPVRQLARCAYESIGRDVPVPAAFLSAKYMCGETIGRYRITNTSDWTARIKIIAAGKERWLDVAGRADQIFHSLGIESVNLYTGAVELPVQDVPPPTIPCE